jgi:hypothetical protein
MFSQIDISEDGGGNALLEESFHGGFEFFFVGLHVGGDFFLDERYTDATRLRLHQFLRDAMEAAALGFFGDKIHQVLNFMTLLEGKIAGQTTVFSSAPRRNRFHAPPKILGKVHNAAKVAISSISFKAPKVSPVNPPRRRRMPRVKRYPQAIAIKTAASVVFDAVPPTT